MKLSISALGLTQVSNIVKLSISVVKLSYDTSVLGIYKSETLNVSAMKLTGIKHVTCIYNIETLSTVNIHSIETLNVDAMKLTGI